MLNQNQFGGSYLQKVQSAIDQTPHIQTVAYIEHLSDEDLELSQGLTRREWSLVDTGVSGVRGESRELDTNVHLR